MTKTNQSETLRQPRVDVRKCMADVLVEQNRLERREREVVAFLKGLIPDVSVDVGKRITRFLNPTNPKKEGE